MRTLFLRNGGQAPSEVARSQPDFAGAARDGRRRYGPGRKPRVLVRRRPSTAALGYRVQSTLTNGLDRLAELRVGLTPTTRAWSDSLTEDRYISLGAAPQILHQSPSVASAQGSGHALQRASRSCQIRARPTATQQDRDSVEHSPHRPWPSTELGRFHVTRLREAPTRGLQVRGTTLA